MTLPSTPTAKITPTATVSREQIESMPAGPEMDALIAERIFGLTVTRIPPNPNHEESYGPCDSFGWNGECSECAGGVSGASRYSTDIAAAWSVVEKMRGGLPFELRRRPDGGFWAYFGEEMSAEADTAPLAICKAALRASRIASR